MKLQYLGDSRDSFKWDLLHYLVTECDFARLYFVPFLTRDDRESRDGNTPPHSFPCRQEILAFNRNLRESRDLNDIGDLGTLDARSQFEVSLFHPERHVEPGLDRGRYLVDFEPQTLDKTLVFFDPDNGFETETRRSVKWVRFSEIKDTLLKMPENSAIAVYQHRPRLRPWEAKFPLLFADLKYAPFAFAIYEANLAFVLLSKSEETHEKLTGATRLYIQSRVRHPLSVWPRE